MSYFITKLGAFYTYKLSYLLHFLTEVLGANSIPTFTLSASVEHSSQPMHKDMWDGRAAIKMRAEVPPGFLEST